MVKALENFKLLVKQTGVFDWRLTAFLFLAATFYFAFSIGILVFDFIRLALVIAMFSICTYIGAFLTVYVRNIRSKQGKLI